MRKPKTIAAAEAAASPESELAGLATTRDSLLARQAAVTAEVEQAVATRRDLLIGNGSAAAIADAERACREIESTSFGIADALAEVERRIAAAEARIEAERTAAEIEAAAAGLERDAGQIEKAATALVRALAEVARARASLAAAISAPAAGQYDWHNGPAGPSQIATALMLQGLVQAVPGLEVHAEIRPWSLYAARDAVEATDPTTEAADFGQRLRQAAAAIRTGGIEVRDLPHGVDAAPAGPPLSVPEVKIHVLAPFLYHRGSHREMVATPVTHVPVPVAERAIEQGLAATEESPKWRRAWAKDAGSAHVGQRHVTWNDCADLAFDLTAWRAEQMREAA